MPRFYIENFGCRATQADGAALERQFLERGLERAGAACDAEIVVLNTCTVTESADKDARASIRRLQRINPECRILVTGCYAQRAPEEVAALPGVTWVVGNSHKHLAAEIATAARATLTSLETTSPVLRSVEGDPPYRTERDRIGHPTGSLLGTTSPVFASSPATGFVPLLALSSGSRSSLPSDNSENVFVGDIFAHTELLAAPVFEAANERTRPNLKVQDGCDNRCSFCVIPYVRGQSRSLPRERVIDEVRILVEAGYREVVISGINLGRWGRDLEGSGRWSVGSGQFSVAGSQLPVLTSGGRSRNKLRLESLILDILSLTSLEKLRISSVEPMDWSDELIELMAGSGRIARHAHVPMQSGSDSVLRRMHRKYRPWHYREKVLKIRAAMPAAAIGADVMVGFPGETEAEFDETRGMVEELPFTYLHVFTYSARPGTPAAERPDQIPVTVARERNRILREIASRKKAAFMRSLVGTRVEAVTLRASSSSTSGSKTSGSSTSGSDASGDGVDFTEALTENYLKIKIRGRHDANRWVDVYVEVADGEMLVGAPLGVGEAPL